ncbi:MAG: hypothetical protein SF187_02705 [Deltaproteobacteria bacterium]|nr:hypothetical protein [Deltaproteobacteria bacterium]
MALRSHCLVAGKAATRGPLLLGGIVCLLALLCVGGCLEPLPLKGKPCPCAKGFSCCTALNICANLCPSEAAPPVTPGPVSLSSALTAGASAVALMGTEATAVALEPNGTLWAGTTCHGLFRRQGNAWTYFDAYNARVPDSGVHALLLGSDGTKWITSRRGYLYAYDTNTNLSVFGAAPLVHAGERARQPLVEDPNGGVWLAAVSGGAAHLVGAMIDRLDDAPWSLPSMPPENLKALGKDSAGNLWATTATTGPARLNVTVGGSRWEAAPAAAAVDVRTVSSSSQPSPLFASPQKLYIGTEPVTLPNEEWGRGVGFIREDGAGRWLCGYIERKGLLLGTRSGSAVFVLDGIKAVDATSDGNKGWWVAAGAAGLVHINESGVVLEEVPLRPATPLPWRERPLAALLGEPTEDVDIGALLTNPFALFGRRIHLRGRFVPQHPTVRFEDDKGNLRMIAPAPHLELLRFWTDVMKRLPDPPLPFWTEGPEQMDFYGYVEVGGCSADAAEATVSFYITEYYPTSSPNAQRAAIRDALVTYLNKHTN